MARLDQNGLGDRVNRLLYSVTVAKRLDATLILETNSHNYLIHRRYGLLRHAGVSEYMSIMKEFLGFNFSSNMSIIQPLLAKKKAKRIHFGDLENLTTKSRAVECETIFESTIESCGPRRDTWCYTAIYGIKEKLKWYRKVHMKTLPAQKCNEKVLGFSSNSKLLNIHMHIRNGDVCYHCDEIWYFRYLLNAALNPFGLNESSHDLYDQVNIVVDAENHLSHHASRFPRIQFFSKESKANGSFVQVFCRFATSDVHVGSGSSLDTVGVFFPDDHPVIFEENRHARSSKVADEYIFTENENIVRLRNGKMITPMHKTVQLLKDSLGLKYYSTSSRYNYSNHSNLTTNINDSTTNMNNSTKRV